MITPVEQQLLACVEGMQVQQVEWTRELIAIPTVNPYCGDDSAGSEAAGQQWAEQRLREMGAQVRRVPVPADVYQQVGMIGPVDRRWDGRENVIGQWVLGTGDGPTVLVNSHMDTVGTADMSIPPYDPVIREGLLFGRGSTDTKGNLVMGLTAVAAVLGHSRGLNGRIIFESVVDEECDGAGAGTLACCLAGITGDVALCLDGAADRVHTSCTGVATAQVLAHGQSGHAAQGAVNAIDKALTAKHAIEQFFATYRQTNPQSRMNVGVFRAGSLPSVVPNVAEMRINFSYAVDDAMEAERRFSRWDGRVFRDAVQASLAALPDVDPWFADHPVEVRWIKDSYPFASDPADRHLQTVLAAANQVLGTDFPTGMMAWFDGAHLNRQLGLPVVGLGFGTAGQAHSAAEHVVVADLFRGSCTVALAIHRLLSGT